MKKSISICMYVCMYIRKYKYHMYTPICRCVYIYMHVLLIELRAGDFRGRAAVTRTLQVKAALTH